MQRLTVLASVLTLAACAWSPSGSDSDASASPGPSATISTPTPSSATLTPNEIDPKAAANYRAALEASQRAMLTSGLTEVWRDGTGSITLVQVYDPLATIAATHDFIEGSHDEVDVALLMPQSLLDELDSLERGDGFDIGSVSSPEASVFVITNEYADEPYSVRYTLDSQGRIATAQVTGGPTITGSGKFTYSVTQEGRETLLLLRD